MTVVLDVSRLPFDQSYDRDNADPIDMRGFLNDWQIPLSIMSTWGFLTDSNNLGFGMLPPIWDDELEVLVQEYEDPYRYTWFAGGWGPQSDKCVASAVRMLRPLLRRDMEWSTLEMVLSDRPGLFRDEVEQVDADGDFPWGDFPHAGAVHVQYGPLQLVGAVDGFHNQVDNHNVAQMILGAFANRILTDKGLPS